MLGAGKGLEYMSIILFLEVLLVLFGFYLVYVSAVYLKKMPKGIVEWAVWILGIFIIGSWIVRAYVG